MFYYNCCRITVSSSQLDKGLFRNQVKTKFGDPPINQVILCKLPHAIQVDVYQCAPESDGFDKFTNVCQELCRFVTEAIMWTSVYLQMRTEIIKLLTMMSLVKYSKKFDLFVLHQSVSLLQVVIIESKRKTRIVISIYFVKVVMSIAKFYLKGEYYLYLHKSNYNNIVMIIDNHYFHQKEMLDISKRIPNQEKLFELAACLDMTKF